MKKYICPDYELIALNAQNDVLTTSGFEDPEQAQIGEVMGWGSVESVLQSSK